MIDRLFVREVREESRARESVRIAVTGLGRCVGTTLVSSSLALYFASMGKTVTFTECADPGSVNGLLYEAVGMDRRFYGRDFFDVYRMVADKKSIRSVSNMEAGVNWLLILPESVRLQVSLSSIDKGRLVANPGSEICIFDIDFRDDDFRALSEDMDYIIAVCDPLPSRIIANQKIFSGLKTREINGNGGFLWLINRMNPKVSKRQIKGLLKSSNISWFDEVPQEIFSDNEYRCRFHWQDEQIRKGFEKIFNNHVREFTENSHSKQRIRGGKTLK